VSIVNSTTLRPLRPLRPVHFRPAYPVQPSAASIAYAEQNMSCFASTFPLPGTHSPAPTTP
jgi:hypothetical protein